MVWLWTQEENYTAQFRFYWNEGLKWRMTSKCPVNPYIYKRLKETMNFLQIVMKIIHLTKPISALFLYYDGTLLLFSRSMRDKDTSALREMFQYSSLVKKPLAQCKIATYWRTFYIQDKRRHGLVKMECSGENSRCPYQKGSSCLKTCGKWSSHCWTHVFADFGLLNGIDGGQGG